MRAIYHVVVAFAMTGFAALPTGAARAAERGKVEERNGPYLGIQPGLRDSAPGKVDVKSKGAVRVATWIGFQMQGGGGRVFIQTTEPAVYNLLPSAADEVVVELTDTRLQTRNDGRPLDTTFFPTAVAWVDADQQKATTRVTVKLREVVGYDLRQEGNYLVMDFRPPTQPITLGAPPSETPAAPAEPAPPPPPEAPSEPASTTP